MTRARIKQIRDYLDGDGTPKARRDWAPMNAAELRELLDAAEEVARQAEQRKPSGKVKDTLKSCR